MNAASGNQQAAAVLDEGPCTFEFEGHKFTSGGAYLDANGGTVYIGHYGDIDTQKRNWAITWHGVGIAPLLYHRVYRGNMCRMAAIAFVYNGVRYYGRYSYDWKEICNVRAAKSQTK
jgi:hypothetical protein